MPPKRNPVLSENLTGLARLVRGEVLSLREYFAARFLYGAAIILIVLFEPAGLAGIAQRLTSRFRRGRAPVRGGPAAPPPEQPGSAPTPSVRPSQGSDTR